MSQIRLSTDSFSLFVYVYLLFLALFYLFFITFFPLACFSLYSNNYFASCCEVPCKVLRYSTRTGTLYFIILGDVFITMQVSFLIIS